MTNEEISQKTIRSYLIGGLDEPTTDTLDEISITDPEFADRVAAEQYELIDDWVGGRLDPTERALFAKVLDRSPTLIEKVRISRLMAATPRVAVVERPTAQGFVARTFGGMPRFAYGLAGVALMLAVISAVVFFNRKNNSPELSRVDVPMNGSMANLPIEATPGALPTPLSTVSPTPLPATNRTPSPEPTRPVSRSFVALTLSPPVRGSGGIKSVKIDPGVEYLELNIETDAATEGGKFRVEIDGPAGQTAWRSGSIAARSKNGRSVISVRAPVSRIGKGNCSVRLLTPDLEVVDEHVIRIDR